MAEVQWVDSDAPLVDGCRVRIGDGPHEGAWRAAWKSLHTEEHGRYSGQVECDGGEPPIRVPLGCPVTVLREVQPYTTLRDDLRVALHLLSMGANDPDLWGNSDRRAVTRLHAIRDGHLVPTPDADR